MDVTSIFKASLMAVKMRNKNLNNLNKNRILQPKVRDEFAKNAKEICHKITLLKNLLLENRAAYMKFAAHLKNSAQMSDAERDIIDRESEKFINFYTQHLGQLRNDWKKSKLKRTTIKKQHLMHIEGVIELLEKYLREVNQIHLEQKKYRMQYELETYRFLKLASDKKKIPVCLGGSTKKNYLDSRKNSTDDEKNIFEDKKEKNNKSQQQLNGYEDENEVHDELSEFRGNNTEKLSKRRSSSEQKVALDEAIMNDSLNDSTMNVLSPEDIQMYESENVQLYQELQGLSEEVEQIEKNVVDIARLQEIFTEKVVMQKHDIERIANAVVGSTENVKDANDQIKQAIQRNAGLRVWTLFFLLVMSFTLLFLDWYND